jgi:hypothetical protein
VLTGMRSLYFWRMRSASAFRFSKGCSSLNLERMVMCGSTVDLGVCCGESCLLIEGWQKLKGVELWWRLGRGSLGGCERAICGRGTILVANGGRSVKAGGTGE